MHEPKELASEHTVRHRRMRAHARVVAAAAADLRRRRARRQQVARLAASARSC